jgi:hypothetical protein
MNSSKWELGKLSGTALCYGLNDGGFESRQGLGIFLFTTVSRPALEPLQPPFQWITGTLSLGVKRPGREADHPPPSSVEVQHAWSYASNLQYAFMAWCSIKKKHRDNFTFKNSSVLGTNIICQLRG